jgi:hypothetical protein
LLRYVKAEKGTTRNSRQKKTATSIPYGSFPHDPDGNLAVSYLRAKKGVQP